MCSFWKKLALLYEYFLSLLTSYSLSIRTFFLGYFLNAFPIFHPQLTYFQSEKVGPCLLLAFMGTTSDVPLPVTSVNCFSFHSTLLKFLVHSCTFFLQKTSMFKVQIKFRSGFRICELLLCVSRHRCCQNPCFGLCNS